MASSMMSVWTKFGLKDNMTSGFKKMSKSAMGFGSVLKGILSAQMIRAGIQKIGQFVSESTKLWQVQEAAIANVEATLKSTGGTVGRTLEQLESQARSIQENTFIGDEAVLQGVTAQLLTFTNITGKAFDRTQQAVVDVSAKLNGLNTTAENMKSMSIALGKALNDPVSNLGALGRMGIQFSKGQKDIIKSLAKSGQLAKAQNMILLEIEKQYGGTAAAIVKTSGGIEKSIENLIGDTQEMIGKGLAPLRLEVLTIAKELLPALIPVVNKITKAVKSFIPWVRKGFTFLSGVFEKLSPYIQKAWNIIKPLIGAVIELGKVLWNLGLGILKVVEDVGVFNFILGTLQNIAGFVSDVIKGFAKVVSFLSPVLKIVIPLIGAWIAVQTALNLVLTANPIGLIIVAIGALTAAVLWLIQNWDEVVKGFQFVAGVVAGAVMSALEGIGNFFGFLGEKIGGVIGLFTALASVVVDKVVGAFKFLWSIIEPIVNGIGEFIGGVGDFFGGIGKGITDFFTGGKSGTPRGEIVQRTEAPNAREAEARQAIQFEGNLNIAGAPAGSTATGITRGAPNIRIEMLGAS